MSTYKDSEEGKILPLKVIVTGEIPTWFKSAMEENRVKIIRGTPTFIVWDGEKEIDRIEGYGGYDWFYDKLRSIIERHDLKLD